MTICNFVGNLPDGTPYKVSVEDEECMGESFVTASVQIFVGLQKTAWHRMIEHAQWRTDFHTQQRAKTWKRAFIVALVTIEEHYGITLIKWV